MAITGIAEEDAQGNTTDARQFDPAKDLPRLIEMARTMPNLKAIMIDPIVVLASGTGNYGTQVRRDLMPLFEFAEETGVAIIGISHFSKGTQGGDPVERVTGSHAWGAAARLVMAAVRSEDGKQRRLIRLKGNVGEDHGGFEYTLVRNEDEEQYANGATAGRLPDLIEEIQGDADATTASGGSALSTSVAPAQRWGSNGGQEIVHRLRQDYGCRRTPIGGAGTCRMSRR
jgi:hypothetical protein